MKYEIYIYISATNSKSKFTMNTAYSIITKSLTKLTKLLKEKWKINTTKIENIKQKNKQTNK